MIEKVLVQNILEHPEGYEWGVQGLGMLRMYLDKEHQHRLHVWDSELRIPDVSPMHTHPWHLKSLIVAGKLRQQRYVKNLAGLAFNEALIKCGSNACVLSEIKPTFLTPMGVEIYSEGERYQQDAEEIHFSFPVDGTVTLVERTFRPNTENAYVYWAGDKGFVSAEPCPASPQTVRLVTQRALAMWF